MIITVSISFFFSLECALALFPLQQYRVCGTVVRNALSTPLAWPLSYLLPA
jgi:hypothetical protein